MDHYDFAYTSASQDGCFGDIVSAGNYLFNTIFAGKPGFSFVEQLPQINIISLPKRPDRRVEVIRQMEMEKCAYQIWDGVEGPTPKVNIHKAFKRVVQWAKDEKLESVVIGEDDLFFCGTGAWKYFIDHTPEDYDVYVSSYYSGSHDENFVVTGFCGMTLIRVNSRYYDTFLSLPETIHIDKAISVSGAKVVVSPLFTAIQRPGFSDQRKRFADDSARLKGKEMFK